MSSATPRPTPALVRRVLAPVVLVAVALLTTCAPGWAAPPAHGHHRPVDSRPAQPRPAAARVALALRIALAQRGKPYVWGAEGPGAFDCSGLTSFAFRRAGFAAMPRTAAEQSAFVRHIPRGAMHRGDLIFFARAGQVYHVGLFVGTSRGRRLILHAPRPGQRVHVEPLWTDAWFPATLRFG